MTFNQTYLYGPGSMSYSSISLDMQAALHSYRRQFITHILMQVISFAFFFGDGLGGEYFVI